MDYQTLGAFIRNNDDLDKLEDDLLNALQLSSQRAVYYSYDNDETIVYFTTPKYLEVVVEFDTEMITKAKQVFFEKFKPILAEFGYDLKPEEVKFGFIAEDCD